MKVLWPLAALITSLVVAVPAQAAAPVPVATAHGDCLDGPGVLTMRLKRVSADLTHVVMSGSDLENGRWRGGLTTAEVEPDSTGYVDLKVDVVDHEFLVELDVPGPPARDSILGLVKGRRTSVCAVGFLHGSRVDAALGASGAVGAISHKSGSVAVRGYFACEDGSRWHWRIQAEFNDGWLGLGGHGRVCRNNHVRIPWAELKNGRLHLDRPVSARLVAHSSEGDVRRVSYRLSS